MSVFADVAERAGRLFSDAVSGTLGELRSNSRARTGLAAIGLIVVAALGLRGWSYVEEREAEISALRGSEEDLLTLTSPIQAKAWSAADDRAKKLLDAAQSRLWSTGPVGAAHADFYSWTQQTAAAAGFPNAQVRLGQARRVGANGHLTELSVNVFVPSTQDPTARQAVYTFLQQLNTSTKRVHVRSLRAKFEPATIFEGEFATFVATPLIEDAKAKP